jgi:hypothetical protein
VACAHRGRARRIELADIVRSAGPGYRARHRLSGEQLAALRAIERCRTPALGGYDEVCPACGHRRAVFRSCGNRHCPKCSTLAKERWLAARHEELLPVDYVHVVFTLPHALNPLARRRPRIVYSALFGAASDTLLEFAHDPGHLGATPAILTVLHTWSQTLGLHIHLHCIVTAGGLDPTGRRWVKSPRGFLFPVRAMSRVFRGKYLARLRAAYPSDGSTDLAALVRRLHAHDWVVFAKAPPAGPKPLLDYLARYTHRIALGNDRLLAFDGRSVRFRWRDSAHRNRKRVLALDAEAFLGRFLLHVLPRGFKRVRHYGLLAPGHKQRRLHACRRYFGAPAPSIPARRNPLTVVVLLARVGIDVSRCERCGASPLRFEPLPPEPTPRAPP